jgi:AbrB family looped-hinge helix DNA binding protein
MKFSIQIGGLHMETINATVSSRGYIVLPARLRKEMNIKAGTKVLLHKEENRIVLQPVRSFTQELAGLTAQSFGTRPDDVREYIDGEREER